jgi:hypothetical protein
VVGLIERFRLLWCVGIVEKEEGVDFVKKKKVGSFFPQACGSVT